MPGWCRRRSSRSACAAGIRSSGMPARWKLSTAISRSLCANPASRVTRLRSVRTNSSAPTTSTSDSATWATTRTRRRPNRSRVSVVPRLPAFMASPGAVAVARIAGSRPKSRQVRRASSAMNENTRQSPATSRNTRSFCVASDATSSRDSHWASTAPAPAPATAISTLSASNWRTIRTRDAPSARRTAISRSRAVARASIRFARFAQAMSRTMRGRRQQQPERPLVARGGWTRRFAPGTAPSLKSR